MTYVINPDYIDGCKRLASDIVIRAVKDLIGKDKVLATDALLWFCRGGERIYLDSLGLPYRSGLDLLRRTNCEELSKRSEKWTIQKGRY